MSNWGGYSNDHKIISKKKYFNLKKENKWIKLYVKDKVTIINNKEKVKNLIKINKLLFRRRNLLKINRIRNRIFSLFEDKKIPYYKNYNDYLSLNRIRGLAKWRFLELGYNNYNEFGLVHYINKKYIYEDKKDDYYK
jgi:hypothetical protein